MDLLSVLGIILAALAIAGGHYLEGGQIEQLINVPAALIVFGGTFAAAAIQSPTDEFSRAVKLVGWLFRGPRFDYEKGIESVTNWCVTARRQGLLGLESQAEKETDSFVRAGLQLLVDGKGPDLIRASLEVELVTREQRDLQGARVIESMGGYAPTLGILGAVMGLIHVMTNLDDPAGLGSGIATAFVATIYGVGVANLLFIPLANKIKSLVLARYHYQEMMLEGLLSIAEGQNPRAIQLKLQGYLK